MVFFLFFVTSQSIVARGIFSLHQAHSRKNAWGDSDKCLPKPYPISLKIFFSFPRFFTESDTRTRVMDLLYNSESLNKYQLLNSAFTLFSLPGGGGLLS